MLIRTHAGRSFAGHTQFHAWLNGTENLMALRHACLMLDLGHSDVEKIFYKTLCGYLVCKKSPLYL